jgi:hypothetical protein
LNSKKPANLQTLPRGLRLSTMGNENSTAKNMDKRSARRQHGESNFKPAISKCDHEAVFLRKSEGLWIYF